MDEEFRIHKKGIGNELILPHRKESEETSSKLDKLVKKTEPDSCLDLVWGSGEDSCDGRSCVRIQSFQKEELATWLGDITEKGKSEVHSGRMLCEHYCEHSDGFGILLEDVQLAITGDARVRAPFGDGVERGVMAWSVTNGPETHQRMEDWS